MQLYRPLYAPRFGSFPCDRILNLKLLRSPHEHVTFAGRGIEEPHDHAAERGAVGRDSSVSELPARQHLLPAAI